MKNLLLGFLLGVLVLKASCTYYSYEWWTAESSLACRIEKDLDNGVYPCIYRKMGYARYLGYVNTNLEYTFSGWHLRN